MGLIVQVMGLQVLLLPNFRCLRLWGSLSGYGRYLSGFEPSAESHPPFPELRFLLQEVMNLVVKVLSLQVRSSSLLSSAYAISDKSA